MIGIICRKLGCDKKTFIILLRMNVRKICKAAIHDNKMHFFCIDKFKISNRIATARIKYFKMNRDILIWCWIDWISSHANCVSFISISV